MHTLEIEVVAICQELGLEIDGAPEQGLVEEFSPDRPDEAFDEGIRRGSVGGRS